MLEHSACVFHHGAQRRAAGGSSWARRALWIGVLLAALVLRSRQPDWDAGIAAHPDERFILGAAQETPLGANICRTTPAFPYGHLPVVLAQVLVAVAPEADPLYAARLLSALIGVLLVVLSGACARCLAGRSAGLLGASVAALAPGLIQQAHAYTVDPLGAVFACGGVLAAARRKWWLAGMLSGLAIACKASLGVGLLPLLFLAMVSPRGSPGPMPRLAIAARRAVCFLGPAFLAFVAASPWALLTPWICWEGVLIQGAIVSGRYVVPYTQQYVDTLPVLYPLTQMALWGLGPIVVLLGGAAILIRLARGRALGPAYLVPPWLWTVMTLLIVGSLQVKFPRYMLPLYPWWIAWAVSIVEGATHLCLGRWTRILARCALLLSTGLLGLAQVGVYDAMHPWAAASLWIYEHLDTAMTLGIEAWDHPLPVPLMGRDGGDYNQVMLPIYGAHELAPSQWQRLSAEVDVVIIASRRGYGALSRQPLVYAEALRWYEGLLAAESPVVFARCPHIGPLSITDDPLADAGLPMAQSLAGRCGTPFALRLPRLDESYRVYDAPLVMVFSDP